MATTTKRLRKLPPKGITIRATTAPQKSGAGAAIVIGTVVAAAALLLLGGTANAATTTASSSSGGGGGGVTWTLVQPDTTGFVTAPPGSYLLSLLPANMQGGGSTPSISDAVMALQQAGFTVSASHDVNDIPSFWPADDRGANEWRFELTVPSTGSVRVKLSSGEKLYASSANVAAGSTSV